MKTKPKPLTSEQIAALQQVADEASATSYVRVWNRELRALLAEVTAARAAPTRPLKREGGER
jgi:hypothetical protein